jgi:hypothetical protein
MKGFLRLPWNLDAHRLDSTAELRTGRRERLPFE